MKVLIKSELFVHSLVFFFYFVGLTDLNAEKIPLPSWNDGPAKQAILEFVRKTTDPNDSKYVPEEDRIATFDQDGTLWVEHPLYTQGVFALDRIKTLAAKHPAWINEEPFKAVISSNPKDLEKFKEQDWMKIIAATHTGMSSEAFQTIIKQWLMVAKHPRFEKLYTELFYLPMVEVLTYFRENGFKTYIVTGGGQDFVRAYSDTVYKIPVEQVVGSSLHTKYVYNNGKPLLIKEPKVFFIDDHAGKAIGIDLFIGKKPSAAFGNSTGDREMLEWTQSGEGLKLMMLVYHDDPVREYAYGPAGGLPNTSVGIFTDELMDEAKKNQWIVISMKNDWKRIFSFER